MKSKNLNIFAAVIMFAFIIVCVATIVGSIQGLKGLGDLSMFSDEQIAKMKAPYVVPLIFGIIALITSGVAATLFMISNDKAKLFFAITLAVYCVWRIIFYFVQHEGTLADIEIATVVFLFAMLIASVVAIIYSCSFMAVSEPFITLIVVDLIWLLILLLEILPSASSLGFISGVEFLCCLSTLTLMIFELGGGGSSYTPTRSSYRKPVVPNSHSSSNLVTPSNPAQTGPRPADPFKDNQ